MSVRRGGDVLVWPAVPEHDAYLPGTLVAVVTSSPVDYVRCTAGLEDAGWSIRETIRWVTGGYATRHVVIARRPLEVRRWEERIAPTVAEHGTAVMHLAACRVPGAQPVSATRWPPNLILQHHEGCARPAVPPRFRVSAAAFAGCVDGCPIRLYGTDPGSRPVAVLAPHMWSDAETLAWISALIEPPVCITGV